MTLAAAIDADRRLAILRTLQDLDGHANESVLLDALHLLGHSRTTPDDVRADLAHLCDAGAITLTYFGDKVAVAHLSQRGLDAAAGRITLAGVKRPKMVS